MKTLSDAPTPNFNEKVKGIFLPFKWNDSFLVPERIIYQGLTVLRMFLQGPVGCSEPPQTTFFLKAQFIGQLQSLGPQSRALGSSLGTDIKGTTQADVMSGGQPQGYRSRPPRAWLSSAPGGLREAAPSWPDCLNQCQMPRAAAGDHLRRQRVKAEDQGRGVVEDPKPVHLV